MIESKCLQRLNKSIFGERVLPRISASNSKKQRRNPFGHTNRAITPSRFQLPAPDFRAGYHRTQVIIYGPKEFEAMGRDDRIRACYQHCALKFVMAEQMTNQSLRERFHLPEAKSAIVSQIIAATLDAGLIKADERSGGSRKFARYVPFWA